MHFGGIGPASQKQPVLPERLFQLPMVGQRECVILPRQVIIRTDPECGLKLGIRRGKVPLHGQDVGQVAMTYGQQD